MDHVAILRKDWNLLPKILYGKKKIESRWYLAKYAPWGRIQERDIIYFKDSGEPVTVKAEVEKVMQFDDLNQSKVKKILEKFGKDINFVSPMPEVYGWAEKRKYCILIFLKGPEKIVPFKINKRGYGNACAWMCVGDIKKVMKQV